MSILFGSFVVVVVVNVLSLFFKPKLVLDLK